jgi:hypothetical protein
MSPFQPAGWRTRGLSLTLPSTRVEKSARSARVLGTQDGSEIP